MGMTFISPERSNFINLCSFSTEIMVFLGKWVGHMGTIFDIKYYSQLLNSWAEKLCILMEFPMIQYFKLKLPSSSVSDIPR